MGNFLFKMIFEQYEKYADHELRCPFKQGSYTITNMTFGTNYFVPDTFKKLLPKETKIKFDINVQARLSVRKPTVDFASFMIIVTVIY